MVEQSVRLHLDQARQVLTEGTLEGFEPVQRPDGHLPVTFLVELGPSTETRLIVPMVLGRNIVSWRSPEFVWPSSRSRRMYSHQWLITCGPEHSQVQDGWCSDLTYVVRGAPADQICIEDGSVILPEKPTAEGWMEIEGANSGHGAIPLSDGDVLVSLLGAFAFGRLSA